MRAPVIGYTIELEDPLLRTVEPSLREPLQALGAVAVVLPRSTPTDAIDQLLDLVDGGQLCGGADVDPDHYGQPRHPLYVRGSTEAVSWPVVQHAPNPHKAVEVKRE